MLKAVISSYNYQTVMSKLRVFLVGILKLRGLVALLKVELLASTWRLQELMRILLVSIEWSVVKRFWDQVNCLMLVCHHHPEIRMYNHSDVWILKKWIGLNVISIQI